MFWTDENIFLNGSSWMVQNRSYSNFPSILLTLRNGASQYNLVLDCNNNPGLFDMVQFLFLHQVEPPTLQSEYITFKEQDEDGSFDLIVDSSCAFSL